MRRKILALISLSMFVVGAQYIAATVDDGGRPFDGGRTDRLTLPADVPAKDFWSLVLYDNQTRAMLQTDQQFPSLNSWALPMASYGAFAAEDS